MASLLSSEKSLPSLNDKLKFEIPVEESSRDSGLGAEEDIIASESLTELDNIAQSPIGYSPVKPSRRLDFRSVRCLRFDLPEVKTPEVSVFEDSDDESASVTPIVFASSASEGHGTITTTPGLSSNLNSMGINSQQTRKRPSPIRDEEESTPVIKRRRGVGRFRRYQSLDLPSESETSAVRNNPETLEEHIKSTLDRVTDNADLISDGSKSCCLPTIPGKHQDLKSITPETLAKVVNHEYDDVIENFVIVDCRYPYEYEGGHIKGAENFYTRERIMENMVNSPIRSKDANKRTVIIFHCEFSSERGPKMSRFLRAMDRNQNQENYPELYYPELYLLHGGYKDFFAAQKELCCPQDYVPMHQDDYKEDLRKFRIKSKSWTAGEKSRSSLRRGLKF